MMRSIVGAVDIPLRDGQHLLLGRPQIFGAEYRDFIQADKPGLTERVIMNISQYASHGAGRLHGFLFSFDGMGNGPLSSQGIAERVLALVRKGSALAFIMPCVSANTLTMDKAQLEEMSAELQRHTPVNAELFIEGKTISDLPEMTDKLIYVFKASKKYFSLKAVGEGFAKAMTMTALVSAAVVLAAWAASHIFGVGFAIDAILIAVGWAMIGWAIFSAMRGLWKCVKKIYYAESIKELEDAAKMFAKTVTDFGVELFIGLLTRGAGKMRAKASAKPEAGGGSTGGANPKTKAEVEADNKAKADAAKKTTAPTRSTAFKDDVHPGMHNQSDVEVPYKEYDWDKFKTRREIDMAKLSAEDKQVAKALDAQGRSESEIAEVLSSSTGKNPTINPVKKGDKFYGFQTKGIPKATNNKYWLDEAAFKDVESKYFKKGAWDKEGVKNYLALPCVNSANSLVTAEAQKAGSALQTTIGRATEELPFIRSGSGIVENIAKIMSGGGTQITPEPDLLKILSP